MTSRRRAPKDVDGILKTQVGPRTSAPMWVRPLLTVGEWAVYTALWSYPVDSVFPTHQELADRALCERGSAADAVARFDELKLLVRERCQREDGSDTSNTYFLVEVPTEAHLQDVAERMAKRAIEQEQKRKKRKAANRRYAAKTTDSEQQPESAAASPDGGTAQTAPPSNGGTSRAVPRGSGARSTSGGTAQTEPGYGAGRTHESLGVEVLSKGTVRTSSPPTPSAADVETSPPVGGEDPEQNTTISSKIENQETQADIEAKDFFPTLTDWEAQLLAECRDLAPTWSSSKLTKVIGSRTVREVTARNPELVRRAFLIGARDPKTVPMRMWWVEKCPHWQTALAQITAEAAAAAGPNDETPPGGAPSGAPDRAEPGPAPARRTVPEQRAADRVAPVSPGAPNAAYLAQKAAAAERIAARRQAEELEQQERAARLAEVLGEAGVGGSVRVESTLGDPVLAELPVVPALEPVGGNVATVR